MLRQRKKQGKQAQSLLEYMILVVLILGAFLVFQKYIARAFSGRWKTVGDALGQGRIYDPRKTTECIYDFQNTYVWYEADCFESSGCDCLSVRANATTCRDCILDCVGICES